MNTRPLAVARACLQAYVDKDRTAIESLIADAHRFMGQFDYTINRQIHLEISWQNS